MDSSKSASRPLPLMNPLFQITSGSRRNEMAQGFFLSLKTSTCCQVDKTKFLVFGRHRCTQN